MKNNLLNEESEVPSGSEEAANSDQEIDQEPDPEVTLLPSRAQQAIPSMFMPYIEGPKIYWTANDALYHRLLNATWSVSFWPYLGTKSTRK